jgi:hypothetical protein
LIEELIGLDLQTRVANLKKAVEADDARDYQGVLDELFSASKEYASAIFEFDIMKRMLADGLLDQEELENADKLVVQEEYARETLLENILNANQVCSKLGLPPLTEIDSDCRRNLTSEEMNLYRLLVITSL